MGVNGNAPGRNVFRGDGRVASKSNVHMLGRERD